MKICPKCGAQMEDQAVFCANCGTNYNDPYTTAAPVIPEWDHTAEFDPKDVSDNKVIAMLVYLLGVVGILIALLSQNSPYVSFHVRQALKFLVIETLVGIATAVLCWTIIVPVAAGIFYLVLLVVKIICFVSICKGEAKEPVIIRSFSFLK